ncbi:MAG TPA: lipolytic protein G-D-S-L family [Planctomycetaceae bacterium]|nr:lipolytic protein G-D-S-L family [Planctomycetaceae bacterium]
MQQLSDRQDGVSVRVSRRSFLQAGVVAGGTWVGATMQQQPVRAGEPVSLKEGAVILFQGDSITDAGRIRKAKGPNDLAGLGRGYPLLLAGALLSEYPQKQLQIFNRGISGNKVPDLDRRWEKDTLALKPDVLSILIGVNDIWHKLSGRYNGTVEDYETGYRALLKRTLEALPDVRIVICEPFVLRCGAVDDRWFPEFDQRRAVAKRVADELGLLFVPFQTMFDQATQKAPPAYWAHDGVHPSIAGHALMAKTWRDVVGI